MSLYYKHRFVILFTIIVVGGCALAVSILHSYAGPTHAAWYASAEQLDPIFAVDGTDPNALRASVQSFVSQRDRIADEYSAAEAHEIKNSLYPEKFLAMLPELQAARKKLLTNPSPAHARKYHALLIRTIEAYTSDAKKLAAALRGPAKLDLPIGFVGGLTSTSHMAEVMDTVAAAAEVQKKKEVARYSCAEHYEAASCESLQALSDARIAQVAADASLAPASAPDTNVLATDTLIKNIQEGQDIQNLSPLIALTTPCFPFSTTYMRSWQFTTPGGQQAQKSYVANDAYFWDHTLLASSSGFASALYKKALSMGSVFKYQNIANYYMCPDPGTYLFDIARVISMRELAQSATTSNAKRFLALPLVSKRDAAQYVLHDGSEQAFARYLEGSAHFDETFEELIQDNTFAFTAKTEGITIEFSYLYAGRSYASILFFLDNPTFVPNSPSLFSQIGNAPPNLALRSWDNDLSNVLSRDVIILDAKKSLEVFTELNNR